MSTKFKKEQLEEAEHELRRSRRLIRKHEPRITVQVRVLKHIHHRLKKLAKEEKKTISGLLDSLLKDMMNKP